MFGTEEELSSQINLKRKRLFARAVVDPRSTDRKRLGRRLFKQVYAGCGPMQDPVAVVARVYHAKNLQITCLYGMEEMLMGL